MAQYKYNSNNNELYDAVTNTECVSTFRDVLSICERQGNTFQTNIAWPRFQDSLLGDYDTRLKCVGVDVSPR